MIGRVAVLLVVAGGAPGVAWADAEIPSWARNGGPALEAVVRECVRKPVRDCAGTARATRAELEPHRRLLCSGNGPIRRQICGALWPPDRAVRRCQEERKRLRDELADASAKAERLDGDLREVRAQRESDGKLLGESKKTIDELERQAKNDEIALTKSRNEQQELTEKVRSLQERVDGYTLKLQKLEGQKQRGSPAVSRISESDCAIVTWKLLFELVNWPSDMTFDPKIVGMRLDAVMRGAGAEGPATFGECRDLYSARFDPPKPGEVKEPRDPESSDPKPTSMEKRKGGKKGKARPISSRGAKPQGQ